MVRWCLQDVSNVHSGSAGHDTVAYPCASCEIFHVHVERYDEVGLDNVDDDLQAEVHGDLQYVTDLQGLS